MNRLYLAGTLFLLSALPACGQGSRRRDDGRVDSGPESQPGRRLDTTIAFNRGGAIFVNASNGDITITGSSRNDVRIRARTDRGRIRLEASANRISLDASDGRSGDAQFEIQVPVGVRITARSQNGEITIRGTNGDVDAHTLSGDIHVQGASGHVELASLSGNIEARDVKGDVRAEGTSSEIVLARVSGDVNVETVSGDVTMREMTSRNVQAHSTSSDVSYDGTIEPNGRYELSSHSSDVSIAIPAGAGARFTVSTWSGSIESDFPITLRPGEHGLGSGKSKQFTFDVGSGAARISLTSFSGDVVIRRRGSK